MGKNDCVLVAVFGRVGGEVVGGGLNGGVVCRFEYKNRSKKIALTVLINTHSLGDSGAYARVLKVVVENVDGVRLLDSDTPGVDEEVSINQIVVPVAEAKHCVLVILERVVAVNVLLGLA